MPSQAVNVVFLISLIIGALHVGGRAAAQTGDDPEVIAPVPVVDAAFADYLDREMRLAAVQPSAEISERQPTPAPRPSRSRLSSVPNMFGDFFGGGAVTVIIQPLPQVTFGPPQMFNLGFTQTFGNIVLPNGQLLANNFDPTQPVTFQVDPQVFLGTNVPGTVFSSQVPLNQLPPTFTQGDTFVLVNVDPAFQNAVISAFGPGMVVFQNGVATLTGSDSDPAISDGDQFNVTQPLLFSPAVVVIREPIMVNIPPGGGAAVRRIKISENTSPQPRCRVFFNYSFFNDVIAGIGDVNRYTFGIEHCMADQTRSIEVRMPFAATLAADQTAGVQSKDTEWGNLTIVGKQVLLQNDRSLFSAGLGVTVPTGSDSRLFFPNGQQILQIDNEAVHLLPFVAVMSQPNDRWFWQGFLQFDVDTNGNPVRGDLSGQNLSQFGVLQDTTLMFVDFGFGYQLYQNPYGTIAGIAPMAEVHYATTIQDADFADGNGFMIRDFTNRFDVVNLTLGLNIFGRNGGSIRPGFVIPLRSGDDDQFDYEAQIQGNLAY